MDVGGLLAHVTDFAAHYETVNQDALEKAAKIIADDAKDRIGHYQSAVGPYNAWAPLSPSTQDTRVAKGYPADEPLLREGDLRASIDYYVDGSSAFIGSDLDIALYQEIGTAKIPPRPFLGPAGYTKANEVAELLGENFIVRFGTV